jgi:uncharacterized 2Fe-2S/4Fe-4S cluster protein (DUF4445 family)/ferredoxin
MNDFIRATTHDGRLVTARPDPSLTLAQALFLAEPFRGLPLCSGLGRCGLCRVRFLADPPPALAAEEKRLSPGDLAAGWRLSCLRQAQACELALPGIHGARPRISRLESAAGPLALAVDLGTTSLHWTALDQGRPVARGRELNPQMGLGAEIMSRLAFAVRPGGAQVLRNLVLERLRDIARSLPGPLEFLVLAGNPAMVLLALGLDSAGLRAAPYRLDYAGGDERVLAPDLPRAFIPPLLAPFVGADLSAGLAALLLGPGAAPRFPFLLADLGTNGEFVLALSPDRLLCASVPLGPALEGVGLRFGRTAGPGAVEVFHLGTGGPIPHFVEGSNGEEQTPGLTGPAYLSLAALLLSSGLLEPSGRFAAPATPLARKLAERLTSLNGEPAFQAMDGVLLLASDIEEILKLKAAFNLAFSRLLAEAGLMPADLASVRLAGAVAEHTRASDLERLGFLPAGLLPRVHVAGNTSLAGAELLATDPNARRAVLDLSARVRAIDLTAETGFQARYLERMTFAHVS